MRAAFAACTAGALVGCGDSTTGPKNNQLSAAEAQQVAAAIFAEVDKAMSTLSFSPSPGAHAAVAAAMPTQTFSSNCTNGGSIGGSFTFTDNTNAQGTGTVTGSMSITPNACKVSTGTRLIAVGGSLNYTFSMALVQFAQSGNVTFHGSGAFTWDGGNCAMDYNITLTPQGKETISGTICGESVNATIG
jgi:hypothetical protein